MSYFSEIGLVLQRLMGLASLLITIATYRWQQYQHEFPWKLFGACSRH